MTCDSNELAFAISLTAFVLAAVYSGWQSNSIVGMIDTRHRGLCQALGNPHPLRTAESDRHALALTLFILSGTHKSLGDAQLSKAVVSLRAGVAAGLLGVVAMTICVLASDAPRSLVMLACWS